MANHRRSAHASGYTTVVWAAKIALCFLGVLSLGAVARAIVPAASGALASALPGFRAALCSWFAPPYLFIAVHLIILIIWRLSDQKQQSHCEQWGADDRTVEQPIKMKPCEPFPSDGLLRKNAAPGIWHEKVSTFPEPDAGEHSPSEASCVTTDSCEKSTASSSFVRKKSTQPEFKRSSAETEEDDEAAAVAAATAEAGIENDSMEATWKAIMKSPPRPAAILGRDARQPVAAVPSCASHDELNRRFEDFIRKNHEQIRLLTGRRRGSKDPE